MTSDQNSKNPVPIIMWVLGWVFIFPIPTTFLLVRIKELPKELVYALCVVAWIVFGVIVYCMFVGVPLLSVIRIICLLSIIAGSVFSIVIVNRKRSECKVTEETKEQ